MKNNKKMILENLVIIITLIITSGMIPETATKAVEQDGGINMYGNISATTKEETERLEKTLKDNDYICVSGKNREISDEDFNIFFKNAIPYGEYATKDKDSFSYEYKKIYVYKPYFDEAMEYAKERKPLAVDDLDTKIFETTVLIDYAEWAEKEKIEKIVNEYNDNIPKTKQSSIAYIRITTPFTVKLQIKSISYSSLDEITLKKGTTTIKMLQRGYKITKINNVDIRTSEKTLPYNNNIQLTKEHIENNPYIVDLSKTLSEYKIIALADETNALKTDDEKNIDDKNSPEKVVTDDSSNQNINAEETLTDENFISTKSISIPIFAWIIAGMTIIAIIIFIILKRKN